MWRKPASMGGVLRRRFKPPSTAPGERVYAVGDLHGRLDLLQRLLKQLELDAQDREPAITTLLFLGDVIDRGDQSCQLIELIRRSQANGEGVLLLCGNHEELLLASADGNAMAQRIWLDNGGAATLRSFGIDCELFEASAAEERSRMIHRHVGQKVLDWLGSLPLFYRTGDYYFCHAGVRPGVPLEAQQREDLLWIRDVFLGSRAWHGAVVVHGHSEADAVEEVHNRINVDTGAYRTDILTAIGLEGTNRWFISTEEAFAGELAIVGRPLLAPRRLSRAVR
jgi:serine/threonine protein phosphatase 1